MDLAYSPPVAALVPWLFQCRSRNTRARRTLGAWTQPPTGAATAFYACSFAELLYTHTHIYIYIYALHVYSFIIYVYPFIYLSVYLSYLFLSYLILSHPILSYPPIYLSVCEICVYTHMSIHICIYIFLSHIRYQIYIVYSLYTYIYICVCVYIHIPQLLGHMSESCEQK